MPSSLGVGEDIRVLVQGTSLIQRARLAGEPRLGRVLEILSGEHLSIGSDAEALIENVTAYLWAHPTPKTTSPVGAKTTRQTNATRPQELPQAQRHVIDDTSSASGTHLMPLLEALGRRLRPLTLEEDDEEGEKEEGEEELSAHTTLPHTARTRRGAYLEFVERRVLSKLDPGRYLAKSREEARVATMELRAIVSLLVLLRREKPQAMEPWGERVVKVLIPKLMAPLYGHPMGGLFRRVEDVELRRLVLGLASEAS